MLLRSGLEFSISVICYAMVCHLNNAVRLLIKPVAPSLLGYIDGTSSSRACSKAAIRY